MKQRSINLTQGSIGKSMLLYSLPLIASNLLQVLFNMADVAIVGQFSGSAALGSVGSTSVLTTMFLGFLMGLGSGVNVHVARHFGAKHPKNLSETVHSALLVCVAMGLILLGIGQVFCRPILEILNTKPELIDGAELYLRIFFLGVPAMAVYNFGNGVLSAVGDTKRPLYYLLTAGILNVVLNVLFVVGFHMSVAGVALATVISQYVSATLILISLFRSKDIYGLRLKDLKPTADKVRDVLALGLPAGCQNAIFYIANLFVQRGVNSFDAVVVEGNSAACNSDSLVYDVMAAFYMACSSFIGQNYGAGNRKRVLHSYLWAQGYSLVIGTVMGLSLVLFGEAFLGIFTRDPAVIEAGMMRLTVMGLSYGVSAFMDCPIAASRGLGKSLIPTVAVILGSCVFRIVWIYTVFAWFHTIQSLYLLYICSWIVTAVFELPYFILVYRKSARLLEKPI